MLLSISSRCSLFTFPFPLSNSEVRIFESSKKSAPCVSSFFKAVRRMHVISLRHESADPAYTKHSLGGHLPLIEVLLPLKISNRHSTTEIQSTEFHFLCPQMLYLCYNLSRSHRNFAEVMVYRRL